MNDNLVASADGDAIEFSISEKNEFDDDTGENREKNDALPPLLDDVTETFARSSMSCRISDIAQVELLGSGKWWWGIDCFCSCCS
jgi:hypothetical protein